MKKAVCLLLALLGTAALLAGCAQAVSVGVIGGADGPTEIIVSGPRAEEAENRTSRFRNGPAFFIFGGMDKMRELLLDAETLYTRAQAHDALAKAFGFPADYGRTLDALYDLLTACPPARLTLRHAEKLVDNMGNYGELLLRVLADAAAENPSFVLSAE